MMTSHGTLFFSRKTKPQAMRAKDGVFALTDYRRKLEWAANRALAAPAPTRDTRGTQYHPPSNVYYRNTGHGHIASHGVRC